VVNYCRLARGLFRAGLRSPLLCLLEHGMSSNTGRCLQLAGPLPWHRTRVCSGTLGLCECDGLNPSCPGHPWWKTPLWAYSFPSASQIPSPRVPEETCSVGSSLTEAVQELFAIPSVRPVVFPSVYVITLEQEVWSKLHANYSTA